MTRISNYLSHRLYFVKEQSKCVLYLISNLFFYNLVLLIFKLLCSI